MRPKRHLEHYARLYSDAWKDVDSMRADRGKDLPWWPEWCFLPLAGSYSIVSAEAERQGVISTRTLTAGPLVNDVGILGALVAWRVTQGVYRFDPDVFRSVVDTPVTGDIPHEVFFNLPEWCVYIETPGLTHLGEPMHGFFAHLEYDVNDNRKELRLVLDVDVNGAPFLVPRPLHLGSWTLRESIDRMIKESQRQAGGDILEPVASELAKEMTSQLEVIVSLLLYLCSVNGEIGNDEKRPEKPQSVKTKKGPRLFPPDKPRTWDVGVRMGAAIRHYYNQTIVNNEQEFTRHHTSPRTHIRRAHWHGFWTGSRNLPEERQYILKWISPIIVNPSENKELLPVTIRLVKKE